MKWYIKLFIRLAFVTYIALQAYQEVGLWTTIFLIYLFGYNEILNQGVGYLMTFTRRVEVSFHQVSGHLAKLYSSIEGKDEE